jgi:hypothetical protein
MSFGACNQVCLRQFFSHRNRLALFLPQQVGGHKDEEQHRDHTVHREEGSVEFGNMVGLNLGVFL